MTRKDGSPVPGYAPLCDTANGHCPLCPLLDGTNHVLGGCDNPLMEARYTARHNNAVLHIHNAVRQGSLGAYYTVLDATSLTNLPPGVSDNRLPKWLLPGVSSRDRERMRPDMLVVEGLLDKHVKSMVFGSHAYRTLKRKCIVHVLEVGYCAESRHTETLEIKKQQHAELLSALIRDGWTVHNGGIDVVLLGTVGTVFKPFTEIMQTLQIPTAVTKSTIRTLSVHAVKTAHSIVLSRRELEHPTRDQQPP